MRMTTRLTPGDRVVFRDDPVGPVYLVLSVTDAGIARLRYEPGTFDPPPVDVSHLWRVDELPLDRIKRGAGDPQLPGLEGL